jgi:uncharacterized damage-inducible protein DinB
MTTTWTAPVPEREEPPRILPERQALEAWLDYHRQTLLAKCAGLSSAQLKERAVPPSNLSLLGLVRHMTDVERGWFCITAADHDMDPLYSSVGNEDGDFDDSDDGDAEANLRAFSDEIRAAKEAVAQKSLDDVVRSHGHHPERTRDIRWIYIHMIEEYARHNGHADLIRERIDGATGI